MSDNVVMLNVETTLDIPSERVLSQAADAGLCHVVVIGYDSDRNEYFASSIADGADVLWMLERAKLKLLRVVDK